MKFFVSLLLVLAMVGAVAGIAAADAIGDQPTRTQRIWADGVTNLSASGWTLCPSNAQDIIDNKSRDYSVGTMDAGQAAWGINDNNGPNAYMRMFKDTGTIDQSQGIVMARIKAISGTNTSGTFGYTSVNGNHGVVMGVRDGELAFKTANGGNTNAANASINTTSDYRVYAVRWYMGGYFDAYYSLTNDWSANSADWVKCVTNGYAAAGVAMSAMQYYNAGTQTTASATGVLLGSFGSSGNSSNTNVSWIATSKYGDYMNPWAFNPAPLVTPEPGSILALSSGLIGMAGFAIRRRRA